MKIPTSNIGSVKTRPVGENYSTINFDTGTDNLVQGVGQLGAGVETLATALEARAKKAAEKANAAIADGLRARAMKGTTDIVDGYDEADTPGEQQIGPTGAEDGPLSPPTKGKHVKGYLDTQGVGAYEAREDTDKKLQKVYADLLKEAPNPEVKAALEKHINALREQTYEKLARHEGQQLHVADLAGAKSMQDATIHMASVDFADQSKLDPFVQDSLASIRRTVLPEQYQEASNKFLAEVSTSRISSYVVAGDLPGATERFKADKHFFDGKQAERIATDLKDRTDKAAMDAARIKAEGTLATYASEIRNGYGFIEPGQEEAFKSKAMKLPPGPAREAALNVAEHYARVEVDRREAVIKQWKQQAQSMRATGKHLKDFGARLTAQLVKYDPDYILSVQAHEKADYKSWKVEKDGTARERSAEKAKQKSIDMEYFYTLKKALSDDPGSDPEKVLQDFVVMKSKLGQNVMISPTMEAHGESEAATTSKKAETQEGRAELIGESADRKDIELSLRRKYKKVPEAKLKAFLENAMEKRKLHLKPGQARLENLTAFESEELLAPKEWEVPGMFYGTNTVTGPGVEEPIAKTPPKVRPGRYPVKGKPGKFANVDANGVITPE